MKGWEERTVGVRFREGRGGTVPYHAYTRDGIAVHRMRDHPGRWTITHIRSGRAIAGGLSFLQARALAAKLLLLGRWDRSASALAKGLRAQAKELLKTVREEEKP